MSKLDGFDEFINMCDEMKITDDDVSSVMRKALKPVKSEAQKNAPVKSGKTKTSIKIKLKRTSFGGTIGTVYVDDWRAMFQEFRNIRQSGKHVGWFERSVNNTGDSVVEVLQKELIDNKVK